jgi:hypothetical protein
MPVATTPRICPRSLLRRSPRSASTSQAAAHGATGLDLLPGRGRWADVVAGRGCRSLHSPPCSSQPYALASRSSTRVVLTRHSASFKHDMSRSFLIVVTTLAALVAPPRAPRCPAISRDYGVVSPTRTVRGITTVGAPPMRIISTSVAIASTSPRKAIAASMLSRPYPLDSIKPPPSFPDKHDFDRRLRVAVSRLSGQSRTTYLRGRARKARAGQERNLKRKFFKNLGREAPRSEAYIPLTAPRDRKTRAPIAYRPSARKSDEVRSHRWAPFNLANMLRGKGPQQSRGGSCVARADPSFAEAWYNLSDLLGDRSMRQSICTARCSQTRITPTRCLSLLQRSQRRKEAAEY